MRTHHRHQSVTEAQADITCPACEDPRYETAYELGQRTGRTDSVVCTECGAFVMDTAAHTRFHSILSPLRGDLRT